MSDRIPPPTPRRTLILLGAGIGVVLAGATAVALVGGLAIADQPGRSLLIPPVVVTVSTASPTTDPRQPITPIPTPTETLAPTAEPTVEPEESAGPELVPAPVPVIVDDHGGDRPGKVDNSGSGSGGSGSGGSDD